MGKGRRWVRLVVGRCIGAALMGSLVWLGLARPQGWVEAHGGGVPQLVDAAVGPYRLYVWSKPDPMRVGPAHLTIGVFERPAGEEADVPVLEAEVMIRLEPLENAGEGWTGRASREDSVNKLYYESDLELPAAGRWQATIEVVGPAGEGSAQFDFEAYPPGLNWTLVGGGAAALLAAGWWFWGARGQRETVDRRREF